MSAHTLHCVRVSVEEASVALFQPRPRSPASPFPAHTPGGCLQPCPSGLVGSTHRCAWPWSLMHRPCGPHSGPRAEEASHKSGFPTFSRGPSAPPAPLRVDSHAVSFTAGPGPWPPVAPVAWPWRQRARKGAGPWRQGREPRSGSWAGRAGGIRRQSGPASPSGTYTRGQRLRGTPEGSRRGTGRPSGGPGALRPPCTRGLQGHSRAVSRLVRALASVRLRPEWQGQGGRPGRRRVSTRLDWGRVGDGDPGVRRTRQGGRWEGGPSPRPPAGDSRMRSEGTGRLGGEPGHAGPAWGSGQGWAALAPSGAADPSPARSPWQQEEGGARSAFVQQQDGGPAPALLPAPWWPSRTCRQTDSLEPVCPLRERRGHRPCPTHCGARRETGPEAAPVPVSFLCSQGDQDHRGPQAGSDPAFRSGPACRGSGPSPQSLGTGPPALREVWSTPAPSRPSPVSRSTCR